MHTVIARRSMIFGLFTMTLATLMYETLLTRIFSVTMWYHFAFFAISVALFGMTVGAIIVYLFPARFTPERAAHHMAVTALLFAASSVVTLLIYLTIPFNSLVNIALTYVVISIPFILSGTCASLALTRFPAQISKLYAADLAGAALGCIMLVVVLSLTDGPTAVVVVGILAALSAACFARSAESRRVRALALIIGVLFSVFAVVNTILANQQMPLVRLVWTKDFRARQSLYEKWNSFSYIAVEGDPDTLTRPFGWGLSATYPSDRLVRQLFLTIDAAAATPLTQFDGDLSQLDFLRYDVTNVGHYLRSNGKMLVVGPGGGRDLLAALAFGQREAVGVEINQNIIDAVNSHFGDFTGHLDRDPRIKFVNDDARSFIASHPDQYDVIQISLIDTWAATSAGAFAFTENALYTVEAWQTFLEHLTPDGVLSISRWYFRDRPAEVYRLVTLAGAALQRLGLEDLRSHIIIVRHMKSPSAGDAPDGVGTVLVSKQPFSDKDVDTIERVAKQMQFDVVLSPRTALDATFETLASGRDLKGFLMQYPLNIGPPTDDSPFFFHLVRLSDLTNLELQAQGNMSFNAQAVWVLRSLAVVTVGLTVLCIAGPLILTRKRHSLTGGLQLLIFFASIGTGFMLIEISQMQRLTIFLGHPTYSLVVVLFTLLLTSGLGSYTTQKISQPGWFNVATHRLLLLCGMLLVFGLLTPFAIGSFRGSPTAMRILVAIVLLSPIGFFMGMAFPIGMKLAVVKVPAATPWLWGINGAFSVCSSVFAVVIALNWSISTAFWAGLLCYGAAFLSYGWASRRSQA